MASTGHDHHDHPPDEYGAHPGVTDEERREFELLEQAIRELLIAKGVFSADDVRRVIDRAATRTPADGARVVARAWTDPAYKKRLLETPKQAIEEMGYDLGSAEPNLVVLEQTERLHHLVVCTLCSCYPRVLLGPPPDWYKSKEYRARAVVDPRGVLREFGTTVATEVEVRVVDSTADMRYLVLPQRPPGSEQMDEKALAKLVTRDCMVGVTLPDRTGRQAIDLASGAAVAD
ncbi:MAG: nitrile hydratase subunit alpha [Alphaproteobacteria bacterium]|nr:nitrile hydratase subunit alpha [Alphaproteobacteria bacterium]